MLWIGVFSDITKGYDAVQRAIIMMFPADPSRIVTNVVEVDEMTISVMTHLFPVAGVQLIVSVTAPRVLNFVIGDG